MLCSHALEHTCAKRKSQAFYILNEVGVYTKRLYENKVYWKVILFLTSYTLILTYI